jgi:hypothetical protein
VDENGGGEAVIGCAISVHVEFQCFQNQGWRQPDGEWSLTSAPSALFLGGLSVNLPSDLCTQAPKIVALLKFQADRPLRFARR